MHRPWGQTRLQGELVPQYIASQEIDFECGLGAYVYGGNKLGERVVIEHADASLFGVTLLNGWAARDLQRWQSQASGSLLGKTFATSVSPWVVSMEALAPYRVQPAPRAAGDPESLDYLTSERLHGLSAKLEVSLQTEKMRKAEEPAVRVSSADVAGLYWTFAQMVAQQTSDGCNLLCGDLIASGTVSGPHTGSEGCLLEKTHSGAKPLTLPNGETRGFLEDGDEVILTGYCERQNLPRIELGECRGRVLPEPGRTHA